MGRSISAESRSQEVRKLDSIGPASDQIGPKQLKASLPSDRTVGLPFNQVQAEAIVRFYGSVKATAYALSEDPVHKPLDPSLMQREFKDGKFARFDERADLDAKAYVANALAEAFGTLGSREARVQQLKRTIEDSVNEMAQLAVIA